MTATTGAPIKLAGEYEGRPGEILARLQALYPTLIDLSLDRLRVLLDKLGNPERALPPVIHVAGTNGKGSTCANLRAIAEAAGLRVHVTTSPHLVSVRERFRLAGNLVDEATLADTLEEVARVNNGAPITVFEVLMAAGFLMFSRVPADLLILEVGLGGRLDATNVVPAPRVCVITPISLDHQAFLGETLEAIASEKAGIIKAGTTVICADQPADALAAILGKAQDVGASVQVVGQSVTYTADAQSLHYTDATGTLDLPLPALRGPHQAANATLAIAALRASGLPVPNSAYAGIAQTQWPARLQTLHGTLAKMLPSGWDLYLDGGHNPGAGVALGAVMENWRDAPIHVIAGVKQTKDASGFLAPVIAHATTIQAVSEPDQHLAMTVEEIIAASGGKATPGPTIIEALHHLAATHPAPKARVLICGSLYLAGVALAQDGWEPR